MDITDNTYQQICSVRTVQSDKKGFFNEFFLEVKEQCGEKWLKNYFSKLKSNEARILSIFSDREICDPVLGILENVQPVFKEKDAMFSSQRRLQADKYHLMWTCSNNKEELQQALAFANLAIMRAPAKGIDMRIDDGLSLALALRSRAVILIALGEGERALSDLKLASCFGLESKQSIDYYIKMARAYACMGEMTKAEISLKIAEKFADGSNALIDGCRQELPLIKVKERKSGKVIPLVSHGENSELSSASNLLKLVETKEKGRFIVAKEPVKVGDVVLSENPVAACLHPSHFGSNCHHCFEKLITPVPCLSCSGIAFCSTQCMGEACDTYHRFECEYMDLFIGSGMSILCYIALRVFTQAANLKEALNTANLLYQNLCSHADARQAEDLLQRSLMSAFLLRCLQKAHYFGRRKTEGVNPTAVELQVGTALLGLLEVLQYNAHEIHQSNSTDKHDQIVYIGAGLYGTAAYFNHECWPSVARYFVGKTLILSATKPHRSNEIVAENYGPIFTKINLKERQRSLRGRYLFSCNCMACQENWPTLQKLDKLVRFWCISPNCNNILQFPKDLSKDVRCARCRKNISLKDSVAQIIRIEELYREAAQAMQDQKLEQAIEMFREGIEMFFQIAILPHKDTISAQSCLTSCLSAQTK